jgi:hypothetical protein
VTGGVECDRTGRVTIAFATLAQSRPLTGRARAALFLSSFRGRAPDPPSLWVYDGCHATFHVRATQAGSAGDESRGRSLCLPTPAPAFLGSSQAVRYLRSRTRRPASSHAGERVFLREVLPGVRGRLLTGKIMRSAQIRQIRYAAEGTRKTLGGPAPTILRTTPPRSSYRHNSRSEFNRMKLQERSR